MSDTWQDLQAFKSKQASLKEKLARRKKERQEVVAGILASDKSDSPRSPAVPPAQDVCSSVGSPSTSVKQEIKTEPWTDTGEDVKPQKKLSNEEQTRLESLLVLALDDATLEVPCSAEHLIKIVSKAAVDLAISMTAVEDLLQKFSAQALVTIRDNTVKDRGMTIEAVDHNKIAAFAETLHSKGETEKKRKRDEKDDEKDIQKAIAKHPKREDLKKKDDLIESLLSASSAKEKENQKLNDEILELLSKPTAKEMSLVEKFRSQKGATAVQEFCPHGTKEECKKVDSQRSCDKLHFKKILHKHTDESLGDCSFLNTCYHMDSCKYVHYEVDYPEVSQKPEVDRSIKLNPSAAENITLTPPQWVQCDMRYFQFSTLGKFSVVMADPPWDIHMELPYGTMSDDEMRNLPVPSIQDDGFIFLWVTGRAMELGRECLKLWGYERVDELIWVKTNQLQRIIRTGRTGHWLNHGKEHCLIAIKGNPQNVNRGLDCDVIVAEVRATSHKPDEVYGMIERLSPGTRKIELFGRPHNVQPNWVTLGNQVDGVKLLDPQVVRSFREKYPDPKMAMLPPDKAKRYYETGKID